MKAAFWYGRKDIRVVEIDEPRPKSTEVKIAVKWCGICGSDLHEYLSGPILIPTSPHPLTGAEAPVIMGHEFSGEVTEVGSEVSKFAAGDRVTADTKYYCHTCYHCMRSDFELCENMAFMGLASGNGAFADYICVPEELVYNLPSQVTYEQGAMVEPLAIGIHAVRRGFFREGDTACVVGAGPIGLMTIQALNAAGARRIFAIEIAENRARLASKFGAQAIDPRADPRREIFDLTNGVGVDSSFECVGKQQSLKTCLEVVKKGGTVVVSGIFEEHPSLDFTDLVISEKKVVGSTDGDFAAGISLIATNRVNVDAVITSRIELSNIIDAFEQLATSKDSVKILVRPNT